VNAADVVCSSGTGRGLAE